MRKWLALGCCLSAILSAAAQPASPVLLSAETVGLDEIANVLVSAFDRVDVLALADAHQQKANSDLRIAVVRHPSFPSKVRFVVVEFANTADQNILDRYISGDDVPVTQLRRVWRNTCCGGTWDSPVYLQFFAAVRDVNEHLPPAQRIRVLAGDPPAGTPTTQRDSSAASVLREHVLGKGKALVIYGGGHLSLGGEINAAVRTGNGRSMFVVEAHGGKDPDFIQFDHALKSSRRPVLFSIRRSPFSEMGADFLGRGTKALVNGEWVDVNPAQGKTLAEASDADAFVYFGSGADAEIAIRP